MYIKHHKFVDVPQTRWEIRREFNVRESCHTVALFDRRYQNIDTGKFDTERLQSINSYSLYDIVDDSIHNNISYNTPGTFNYRKFYSSLRKEVNDSKYDIPKFVPKDNNFDEEVNKIKLDNSYLISFRAQEALTQKIIAEHKNDREAYAKRLAEVEQRLAKEQEDAAAKYRGPLSGPRRIVNCWKPK